MSSYAASIRTASHVAPHAEQHFTLVRNTTDTRKPSTPPQCIKVAHGLGVGIDVAKKLVYTQPLNAFPGELPQILTNLISNAVEAMQGRTGTLFVRVHPARDWCAGQNEYRIVIADTGPRIPEQRRKKIFEPFYTIKGEKGTAPLPEEFVHRRKAQDSRFCDSVCTSCNRR